LEDYDELPDENTSAAPLLPPKASRPDLPPKQRVGKSREDLAAIERSIRASASELVAGGNDDLDYDDPPEEEGGGEDYDDPVSRVVAEEGEDYDEPPIQHGEI